MSYVKPVTFVDGNSLDAADINANDFALKKYINGGIIQTDLDTDAFDTPELSLGEFEPITNEYTFATGIDKGLNTGIEANDRAYFTSNIKKGRQTDNNLYLWTSLYHTAPEVVLQETADVVVTFGGTFVSNENTVEANGFWDSMVKLAYTYGNDQALTFIEGTRSYTFEETFVTSTISGNNDPFGATTKPSVVSQEIDQWQNGLRRWIGCTAVLRNLPAGSYKFSYHVNPKVEQGYTSARNFKTEVFYR